ncbi:uncharacterized protein LOC133195166 [Saccostrea echinata]|uniref:uncharacterized protein LOC133195166 n=1 Tax=Saccostrea echinata TaxID=191078 RepID=UPI002A7F0224|nr:uncharacterized protein LOC133195166 [Saccostrea echinata]
MLTDTQGNTIHNLMNVKLHGYGVHTVSNGRELIYIDNDGNINKLNTEAKTTTTLIKKKNKLEPLCIYSSQSTGDLLVGTKIYFPEDITSIIRYKSSGKRVQTITDGNWNHRLYGYTAYITENLNGDVIVSDLQSQAVVVIDRAGKHRFSFTESSFLSPESDFSPYGICTDTMSNILVCDENLNSIHIIDKDGHHLQTLTLPEEEIYRPRCIDYDEERSIFRIGSWYCNTLCLYRYVTDIHPSLYLTGIVFADINMSSYSPSYNGLPSTGSQNVFGQKYIASSLILPDISDGKVIEAHGSESGSEENDTEESGNEIEDREREDSETEVN